MGANRVYMSLDYEHFTSIKELYSLLQDELSRKVFAARLMCDLDITTASIYELSSLREGGSIFREDKFDWKKMYERFSASDKRKMILYGADDFGKALAKEMIRVGEDFYGFCDKRYEEFPQGLFGKPVFSCEQIINQGIEADYYIIITAPSHYKDIKEELCKKGFLEEHILPLFEENVSDEKLMNPYKLQYFEFPELYQEGTTFVDAGCFDFETSEHFIEWCKGKYEKVIAFEPDIKNFTRCVTVAEKYDSGKIELVNAGLGETRTEACFETQGMSTSHIIDTVPEDGGENSEVIKIRCLDDYTDGCKVGFIKMDIEGFELHALTGARETILRDRPLLAASVYHKPGDVVVLMDYLHELVPEYRFYLRHYGHVQDETVLYAAI